MYDEDSNVAVTYFLGYEGGNGWNQHLAVFVRFRSDGRLIHSADIEVGYKGYGEVAITRSRMAITT